MKITVSVLSSMTGLLLVYLGAAWLSFHLHAPRSAEDEARELAAQLEGSICSWQHPGQGRAAADGKPPDRCERRLMFFPGLQLGRIGCRVHAAYCLSQMGPYASAAYPILQALFPLRDPSPDRPGYTLSHLQAAAARLHGVIGDAASADFLAALLDEKESPASEAASALRRLGPQAAAAAPNLMAHLKKSGSSIEHASLLAALQAIDPLAALPLLREALEQDQDTAQTALRLLRRYPGREAAPALRRAIERPELLLSAVQTAAAVENEKKEALLAVMPVLMMNEKAPSLHTAKKAVLHEVTKSSPPLVEASRAVFSGLKTRNYELWYESLRAAAALQPKNEQTLRSIAQGLRSDSTFRQAAAQRTLQDIPSPPSWLIHENNALEARKTAELEELRRILDGPAGRGSGQAEVYAECERTYSYGTGAEVPEEVRGAVIAEKGRIWVAFPGRRREEWCKDAAPCRVTRVSEGRRCEMKDGRSLCTAAGSFFDSTPLVVRENRTDGTAILPGLGVIKEGRLSSKFRFRGYDELQGKEMVRLEKETRTARTVVWIGAEDGLIRRLEQYPVEDLVDILDAPQSNRRYLAMTCGKIAKPGSIPEDLFVSDTPSLSGVQR